MDHREMLRTHGPQFGKLMESAVWTLSKRGPIETRLEVEVMPWTRKLLTT